jgi:hypothetical protein
MVRRDDMLNRPVETLKMKVKTCLKAYTLRNWEYDSSENKIMVSITRKVGNVIKELSIRAIIMFSVEEIEEDNSLFKLTFYVSIA